MCDKDMSTTTILREKLRPLVMYIGFLCSCGLYEFGGVFWMTYFNPFLQTAIGMSSGEIGTIVLIAQITDAVANPLVGIMIEHLHIPFFGNKRGCHLIGSVIMIVCFPLLWMQCWFCSTETHSTIYYSVIAGVMNCCAALMFLPHLSMIAVLAKNDKQRLILGGISSFGKQFWGILAYSTLWFLIGISNQSEDLGQILSEKLKIASYVVSAVGVICTIIFNASIWKMDVRGKYWADPQNSIPSKKSTIKDIIKIVKSPNFYFLGLLYFVCRSQLCLYNVYQVFYYEQTLKLPTEAVAYLPFIYLSFAGIGSIAVKKFVKRFSTMATFVIAILAVVSAGVAFILQPVSYGNAVIVPVMLVSIGTAVMYTLSLSFTSSLIVKLRVSDVVIWGAYNLLDRILFGVLFVVVQKFRPCPHSRSCCEACGVFYRYTFGGGIIILAVLAAMLVFATRYTGPMLFYNRRDKEEDTAGIVEKMQVPEVDVQLPAVQLELTAGP